MAHEHHHDHSHEDLMQSLAREYQHVLENSAQGVYIYFDDANKVCNKKFATLLGYASENEWAIIGESFPDTFVAAQSQETLVGAYQDAMHQMIGSTNTIEWKKKDGNTVSTTVILVPIVYDGHFFALHFVTPKN